MFAPNNTLIWLDIMDSQQYEGTLEDLFKRYAHFSKQIGEHEFVVKFENNRVKIQDWYGFTDMKYIISRSNLKEGHWVEISTHDHGIVGDDYAFIPIYEPEQKKEGYHGHVKTQYTLYHMGKLIDKTPPRYVREKYTSDDQEFANIHCIHRSEFIVPQTGYELVTRSQFMVLNNIYVYSSDEMDIEEVEKWN